MNGGEIKARLNEGGAVFGMMITLVRNPKWSIPLSGGGIDYAIIDTEHSQRGRNEISDLVLMLKSVNIAPIVRIPFPVPHYVAMALDAGADGVLVPYCETTDEVRACVAVKQWHPLKGAYLRRVMETGEHINEKTRDYLAARHRDHIIIIGIESEPGYRNLDSILGVDGVDAIFVGPNDMSTSLGIPDEYDNPRYWAVIEDIIRKSTAAGRPVMVHQQTVETSRRAIELGARFVLYSSDGRMMQRQMQADFGEIRNAMSSVLGAAQEGRMEDTIETV